MIEIKGFVMILTNLMTYPDSKALLMFSIFFLLQTHQAIFFLHSAKYDIKYDIIDRPLFTDADLPKP